MARTKGAKGKKTLAKEKGMTLEQYLEYEKNLESTPEPIGTEVSTEKGTEQPTEKLTLEIIMDEEDLKEDLKKDLKKDLQKDLKDKNLESSDTVPEEINIKIKTRRKKDKESILCERCHKPITGPIPFKINLTYLTTTPAYHRQTDSDRVQLCEGCISELSHMIDRWLWNNGEGMELKYGQKEFQERN